MYEYIYLASAGQLEDRLKKMKEIAEAQAKSHGKKQAPPNAEPKIPLHFTIAQLAERVAAFNSELLTFVDVCIGAHTVRSFGHQIDYVVQNPNAFCWDLIKAILWEIELIKIIQIIRPHFRDIIKLTFNNVIKGTVINVP